MKTFEKIVSIDEYKFRITISANASSRSGKWSICQVYVKDIEQNKIIYKNEGALYGNPLTLKRGFKIAAKLGKKALLRNKKISRDIEEFKKWDGVIKS
ncbi:hypothetical protein [Bacillus safensis]|uniref:hypothetical protein n=1 Tax=Bacillus safensis TaxID=561879 RepID=UPI00148ED22A|nr:hypothetical protein [Bacillus safensis]NOL36762.1 hypothetical protein [Bacillus safensis]